MGVASAIVLAATMLAVTAFLYQLYSATLAPTQRRGFLERQVIGPLTWPSVALLTSYAVAIAASCCAPKFYWDIFAFVALMICIASTAQSQLAKRNEEGYTWAAVILLLVLALIIASAFLHAPPFSSEPGLKSASSM